MGKMILEVSGVTFSYRSRAVLNDVTFSVNENEILGIMGPNGVGKTTLLKCINLLLKPTGGSILLDRNDISSWNIREIAEKIGYVSQRIETNRITAFDAILLGRHPHFGVTLTESDLEKVDAAISMIDLQDLSLQYINEMSGGELQKVAIARAMVQEPRVMLLDEPTSNLDLHNQVEILKIMRQITRQHAMAVIMTMHDLNMALRFMDRFIFLKDGSIFSYGSRVEITSEMIEEVYNIPVSLIEVDGYPVVIPKINFNE
jgi:iron complex transport system ATP-binding protein